MKLAILLCLTSSLLAAQQMTPLLNGKNLDGWEVEGNGVWSVMSDGTLLGQRDPKLSSEPHTGQSWLYTKKEFGQFDLHVEYWIPLGGNSGVSLRDPSRAKYSFGPSSDPKRTPAHIGYEIQIINVGPTQYPTGSIYLFQAAPLGAQRDTDWNTMDIESRNDIIRVRVNGKLVAEHAGDPQRSKTGPIGLQLHDKSSLIMFRNIRIRER